MEKENELSLQNLQTIAIEKAYEDDGKWIVEGWASTSEIDSENLRMMKPALEDMAREYQEMQTVLHNHNPDEEIGTILKSEIRKKSSKPEIWGCWVKVLISKTVPAIWKKVQEKVLNGFSVRGKAKIQEIFSSGKVIQEAIAFVAAELSIVSVRALRPATIEEVYIEKFLQSLKEGGKQMEEEKISMADAKSAIQDLIKIDGIRDEVLKAFDAEKVDLAAVKKMVEEKVEDADEKDAVLKILEAVEEEAKSDSKEDEKKPLGMDAIKDTVKELSEEDRKAITDYLASLEKPEETAATPEQVQVMESLAGGLKVLLEKVQSATSKSPEEALKALKEIEAAMKKLMEAYPYPQSKKGEEETEEETSEVADALKEKKGEESSEADQTLAQFTKTLDDVNKSLQLAVQKKEDERMVKLGEMVINVAAKVDKLTKVIEDEVPIRKAIVDTAANRDKGEEQSFTDTEEYKKAAPGEKLEMIMKERSRIANEAS